MNATYVSATSFTVTGDLTAIFVHGRRLYCDCGVDGMKYTTTSGSSYGAPNTTVTIYESELTANLTDVEWSRVKPGNTGNMPRHKHDSTEGDGGPINHSDLANVGANDHHNESHTIASHSDTTATGAELETLTDGSDAGALHIHDARYYTETEVDTISGSLSSEIDADISTHAGLPNAHHNRSHAITSIDDHTANNWKILYTDGSGNIQELALGATSGDSLTTTGASSAPEWTTVSGGGGGGVSDFTRTVNSDASGPVTVTVDDVGETFVATAAVEYDLPSVGSGDVGIWYTFVKTAAGTLTIDANDSDTIADSSAGGTIKNDQSAETYATITIQLVTETKWVITGAHGTWETT